MLDKEFEFGIYTMEAMSHQTTTVRYTEGVVLKVVNVPFQPGQ